MAEAWLDVGSAWEDVPAEAEEYRELDSERAVGIGPRGMGLESSPS
jgi:hypothetical protein